MEPNAAAAAALLLLPSWRLGLRQSRLVCSAPKTLRMCTLGLRPFGFVIGLQIAAIALLWQPIAFAAAIGVADHSRAQCRQPDMVAGASAVLGDPCCGHLGGKAYSSNR